MKGVAMKHILVCTVMIVLLVGSNLNAQTPIGSPLSVDLGFGGGVSLPVGDLSNFENTGWHGLAKVRLHGSMPINIVGTGMYNRLPDKVGNESDYYWMISAGIEYPIPSAVVKPYFGIDAMYVSLNNTAAGSISASRGGVGFGAGVEFSLPGVGSFDTSVKYQIINVMGKNTNEITASQIAASVALMLGVM
jgi:hypothetical protein